MTLEEFSKMLFIDYEEIERINKIVCEHLITWKHIADLLEEGIPLIDYMGPEGILNAIIRETEMRHLNEDS